MARSAQRIPEFLLSPHRDRAALHELKARLRRARLHTVCESARCPNIIECFKRPQAAFMILGARCMRGCGFCAVERGRPAPPDRTEPEEVAKAAAELGLDYAVVTSVTRDDLPDGGAGHFAKTIAALRRRLPHARVEVLVPDFKGSSEALSTVLRAGPDVINHNLETVPRLYPEVRPRADYSRSLQLVERAARQGKEHGLVTKSGIMVGLGETYEEVIGLMEDLAAAGCRVMTVGQYLRPAKGRLPVRRYWEPTRYEELAREGEAMGLTVFAGPLVRSSYMADRVFLADRGRA